MEAEKAATFQIGKGVRIKARGKEKGEVAGEWVLDESAVEGSQAAGGRIWLGQYVFQAGGKAEVEVQESHEEDDDRIKSESRQ